MVPILGPAGDTAGTQHVDKAAKRRGGGMQSCCASVRSRARITAASRWHLSIALGREAILAGYTVQFTTATTLVAGLAKAHGERRLDEKLLALSKPKLLIVDELGYLPLEPDAAHLFFQLVSRRYETGAMLITSNRSVDRNAWPRSIGIPGRIRRNPQSCAEFGFSGHGAFVQK
jgi:hypothetical protein